MAIDFSSDMKDSINTLVNRVLHNSSAPSGSIQGISYRIWMQSVLIPKGVTIKKGTTLLEIQNAGGKLSTIAAKDILIERLKN